MIPGIKPLPHFRSLKMGEAGRGSGLNCKCPPGTQSRSKAYNGLFAPFGTIREIRVESRIILVKSIDHELHQLNELHEPLNFSSPDYLLLKIGNELNS